MIKNDFEGDDDGRCNYEARTAMTSNNKNPNLVYCSDQMIGYYDRVRVFDCG